MNRHTYSCLAIARRHPRLFNAMHRAAVNQSDVRDGGDGYPTATLRTMPYLWADVPWRTDSPTRRRADGPRASRFGDLT